MQLLSLLNLIEQNNASKRIQTGPSLPNRQKDCVLEQSKHGLSDVNPTVIHSCKLNDPKSAASTTPHTFLRTTIPLPTLFLTVPILILLLISSGEANQDISEVKSQSWGCTATVPLMQEAFCDHDFAFRIKVESNRTQTGIMQTTYVVKLLRIFKGSTNVYTKRKSATIKYQGSGLYQSLENNKKYLVTGKFHTDGTAFVTDCSVVQLWREVTFTQRKGLKRHYKKHCSHCGFERIANQATTATCFVDMEEDFVCRNKFSTCVHDSDYDYCHFDNTDNYKSCKTSEES